MLDNSYIKVYRSLIDWRWFKDQKVLALWLYLLIRANYKALPMQDRVIERGQLVVSLKSLSENTGLSVKEVRTALDKLKRTGEIITESNRHMTIVTINNYDDYQSDLLVFGQTEGKPRADNGQTNGTPSANQGQTEGKPRATSKERKEREEGKEGKKNNPQPPYDDFTFSDEVRSILDEWLRYKQERQEAYKPTGLNNLLKVVSRETGRLGDPVVVEQISKAMASGWRGMNLDKVTAPAGNAQKGYQYDYDDGGDSL